MKRTRMILTVLLGCLSLPLAGVAEGDTAQAQVRHVGYRVLELTYGDNQGAQQVLTVAVWYPSVTPPKTHCYGGSTSGNVAVDGAPDPVGGPFPLLVFSHGYGGSGLSAVFFTESLAARGWIVVAPDHHDRHSAVRIRTGDNKEYDRRGLLRHAKQIASSGPEQRQDYLYRLDEMKAALDGILASEEFGKLIDKDRIAVGGHSFGGFTALGLCGTIPERHDARVKALLLFSTGAGGYLYKDSELAAVKMPSMYLFGERERDQTRGDKTMLELAEKLYGSLSPPKCLLELKGASHFSFNNRFTDRLGARLLSGSDKHFDLIRRYATAFLETHVAGRPAPAGTLAKQDPLLTRYLHEP